MFISLGLKGQVSVSDTLGIEEYPFIDYEGDTLVNTDFLVQFYDKLLKLENGDSSQVSILHIGDSQIQAELLSSEVRKSFQFVFGNAGRGLVFPYSAAGINEPADYRSSTNVKWTAAKINSENQYPFPGISGISIFSNKNGAYFDITTTNHDDLNYAFDRVTLIHTKDSLQFDCRFTDSDSKKGYLMSASPMEPGEITTSVRFEQPANYVRIMAEQTNSLQSSISINGLILQNSQPGVLYNSVGINGAHFSDYNKSDLFFSQMQVLKPDLVIISLGTTEGADMKVTENEIIAAVSIMLRRISSANPKTCVLIATPADVYFNKKYKNPYLEAVQRALIKSADSLHVAYWDMYSITGGFGSCAEWRQADLMQNDGIHFNKKGYTVQGSLLYKAIMDGYLKYEAY
jgi:lysophospholipase L1-like esterase